MIIQSNSYAYPLKRPASLSFSATRPHYMASLPLDKPPPLNIHDNILQPKHLQALADYFNQSEMVTAYKDGIRSVRMRGQLTFTYDDNGRFRCSVSTNSRLSKGKELNDLQQEALEQVGMAFMDSINENFAWKDYFLSQVERDKTKNCTVFFIRYALPKGTTVDCVEWHDDASWNVGVLTVASPELEGGEFILRHTKNDMAPKQYAKTRVNRMVTHKDQGLTEHSLTAMTALGDENSGDVLYRDIVVMRLV